MRDSSFYKFIAVFFVFITSFSCSCDYPLPIKTSKQLLLVYMVTDRNGLDREVTAKLQSLKQLSGFDSNYRLLVYADTKFEDSGRLIEILPDSTTALLTEFGEINNANAVEFSKIIEYVVDNFKAESYGLLLFSHASGWLPKGTLGTSFQFRNNINSRFRSVLVDRNDELSLVDFAKALPVKFDYIIFESCNMAGIEIAFQLRHKTKRIIATAAQMISPGFTGIYPELIKSLFQADPDFNAFVNLYYNHYLSQDANVISLSVINTEPMEELASIIRAFNPLVDRSIDVRLVQQFDGDVEEDLFFFDFLDFYAKTLPVEQYDNIRTCVDKIIEYKKHTPYYYATPENSIFPIISFSGLSTFIEHDDRLVKEYRKLDWALHTR